MLFRIWKNKTVKEKSIGTKYRWIKVVEGTQGTKKSGTALLTEEKLYTALIHALERRMLLW